MIRPGWLCSKTDTKLVDCSVLGVDKKEGRLYIAPWMIGVSSTYQNYLTFGDTRLLRERVDFPSENCQSAYFRPRSAVGGDLGMYKQVTY